MQRVCRVDREEGVVGVALTASVRLSEGRLAVENVVFTSADVVTAAADAERRGLPLEVWLDGVVRAGWPRSAWPAPALTWHGWSRP